MEWPREGAARALVFIGLGAAPACAQTASPGYSLEKYAEVPTPAHFVFAPDGTLYAGNSDNVASGVFPHRIVPDGAPVEPLSATRIYDPDGVALDVDDAISGVAGSVLVSSIGNGGTGRTWTVRPGSTSSAPLASATSGSAPMEPYIGHTQRQQHLRLTACGGDCDGSGNLDFFDFLCFQDLFAAGDPYADCDASGNLDFFDFLCFQNAFAAGCP